MFFKAKLDNSIFKVYIKESEDSWDISISKGSQIEKHCIIKQDYQKINNMIHLLFKNKSHIMHLKKNTTHFSIGIQGMHKEVVIYNEEMLLQKRIKGGNSSEESQKLTASMPGKIVKVLVKPKDQVKVGQPILIMEAMKMENEIRSHVKANIQSVKIEKGQSVEAGETLVVFQN